MRLQIHERRTLYFWPARGKKCYVHTAVLEAFIGPAPQGFHGRRQDSNVQNNHLANLLWARQDDISLNERRRAKRQTQRTIMLQNIGWQDPTTWGNRLLQDGYTLVHCPHYPRAKPNGYVYLHRLRMACFLGRPLETHEHVHHDNEQRWENRIENLVLTTNSAHRKHHMSLMTSEEKSAMAHGLVRYNHTRRIERTEVSCACGCGAIFMTPDSKGRYHSYKSGHAFRGKHWTWGKKQP